MSRPTRDALSNFICDITVQDAPQSVRRRMSFLLLDVAATSIAGRLAPASSVAADFADLVSSGDEATSLFDGRRLGVVGAAFANSVLANALDLDDGHRLARGHPGAIIIPAALAMAQLADASVDDFMTATLVGYEVAIRAAVAVHEREPVFRASGAWGAIGAAAAGARLLSLDPQMTLNAIDLAEYHAPAAPILRSCADPGMTKDACGWGAVVGVSSALLAARGFTSTRGEFAALSHDIGSRWCVEEVYVKPYPCCRWAHAAIAAALTARSADNMAADSIERVTVRTFEAAAGLANALPTNTEEAQFNLVWPVAFALVHGRLGVSDVLGPFDDGVVSALAHRTDIVVDEQLTSMFPARRLAAIDVALRDGRVVQCGPIEAPGEPEDAAWEDIVVSKWETLADEPRNLDLSGDGQALRGHGSKQLLRLLAGANLG